jgi:hypothetical protein
MSLLASFYVVDKDRVHALEGVEDLHSELSAAGRELDHFGWSGYAFVALTMYLDEQGIQMEDPAYGEAMTVLSEAQGATVMIFTAAQKAKLAEFDPEKHPEEDLARWNEEFSGSDDPDMGPAMRAAFETLRSHVGGLDDSSVLVLIVG